MKLIKPKFWEDKNNLIAILLLPLSFISLIFIFFKNKLSKKIRYKIPIICIGNIYIGGTGKTPTSIFLANELNKLGRKSVILRKFYKSHKDEHDLIKTNFKDLILTQNRSNGIIEAEKNFDIVILDDGFQDCKIVKNLNIICFNSNQLTGNGYVIPAGPLRESLFALKNAQIVLINGSENKKFEDKIIKINKKLNIFYSEYKPVKIEKFKNKGLLAIAGIGNPENFFKLVVQSNLKIEKKLIFPDHHRFSYDEIKNIVEKAKDKKLQIITTEKDYYKIKDFNFKEIDCFKVELVIKKKEQFLEKIQEFYA